MSKNKVIIFSNIPAPYFVDYCEELSKYVDLTVVFELRTATNRQQNWYKNRTNSFKTIFLNALRITYESGLSFKFKKILKYEKYDLVIVGNPTTPTGIFLISYLKKKKLKYAIQSEGGFVGSGVGIKETLKKKIISGANFYLSGMSDMNDYFGMYAGNNSTIYRYHFSSLWQDEIDKQLISTHKKELIKKDLGIDRQLLIVYVGHFIKAKGYNLCLELANMMKERADVAFGFAGGLPSKKDLIFIKNNNMSNVFFFGFLSKEKLIELYHASSLLVLPTYSDTWGLVINEAMSKGCPIVTTDSCIAGLEMFSKEHPECLAKTGDIDDLKLKVSSIINDSNKMKELCDFSISSIQNYSIENMAKEIFKYIEKEIRK